MTNEEIFITFLKSNRCLTKFKVNARESGSNVSYANNNFTCDTGKSFTIRALLEAYSWSRSNEGDNYWRMLNHKWERMCKHFELNGNIDMSIVCKP